MRDPSPLRPYLLSPLYLDPSQGHKSGQPFLPRPAPGTGRLHHRGELDLGGHVWGGSLLKHPEALGRRNPPPGFHRPSGLLHSEWGAPPIRSPRSASQASGGRSRCEAFASAPASTRGQSGGHCTGGPAPGAERGARPGEGVGERRLQARRRELLRKRARCPARDKAHSLLAGPREPGMENPKRGGDCARAGH